MNIDLLKVMKKEDLIMLFLKIKKKPMLKENGKKKCMNYKNTYCSLILLKTIIFHKIFQEKKNSLNMVNKSNFVKEDKIIVRSGHPPI